MRFEGPIQTRSEPKPDYSEPWSLSRFEKYWAKTGRNRTVAALITPDAQARVVRAPAPILPILPLD